MFNKQDQYPPIERAVMLQKLETRQVAIAPTAQLAAIAPAPTRSRYGSIRRWHSHRALGS
ncbi:MAG: hypothetical protein HC839_02755 [Leptolyngbyaceae cyanobacterium RM2_2_21]|nr:hypothetical protein [Leptolyngbyaceae cyanobacterium RM2_2_21]